MDKRPVWVEIDLAAVSSNVRRIKALTKPETKFCAVVKADAYGHGARRVAAAALAAGADWLAVALISEAVELREAGFTAPILILGPTPPESAEEVVAQAVSQTVFTLEHVCALSQAAVKIGKKAKIHIKIDTGMGRIGVKPEEAAEFAVAAAALPGIEVEGVFSHLAAADVYDKRFAHEQFSRFQQSLAAIAARGISIPIRHIANSAATLELPEMHLDMVRPGIILYGLWPSDEVQRNISLLPAMRLKARISYVKDLPKGCSVSYGRTFFAQQDSRIATLPIGYADGWSRLLSGKVSVFIRGRLAPLVGRICMDQCMVDISHIPEAAVGDEVDLFGGDGLTVDEIAACLGTINYEVVCMVSKRVPRVY